MLKPPPFFAARGWSHRPRTLVPPRGRGGGAAPQALDAVSYQRARALGADDAAGAVPEADRVAAEDEARADRGRGRKGERGAGKAAAAAPLEGGGAAGSSRESLEPRSNRSILGQVDQASVD